MALKSVGKDGYGYKCPEGGSTSRIGPPCPGFQPSARMRSLHSSLCAAVMWSVTAVLHLESCATHTHTQTHTIYTRARTHAHTCAHAHTTHAHTHTRTHSAFVCIIPRHRGRRHGVLEVAVSVWRARLHELSNTICFC